MTYATQDDLLQRFDEAELILLTTDSADAVAIDTDRLNLVLSDVDADIDGYIARYLPLTSVPQQLVSIACDLARYRLATRSGGAKATDTIKDRNAEALRKLELASKGQLTLGLDVTGAAVPAAGLTQSVKPNSAFTKYSLHDYMPMNRHHRRWRS